MSTNNIPRPPAPTSNLRFRSRKQLELIKRAALKIDTSMNSFIRTAAEQKALGILGPFSKDSNKDSYKDSKNAQD